MKRNGKLVSKKYLEFFIPTVLTAMATNLASIVDAGIVGNLMDSTALSVINILLPVVQIYAALGVLFGIAVSVIIASSRGRDGTDMATGNRAYTVVCVSTAAVSAVMIALQLVFIDGITALLTPVAELRPLLKQYYIPLILGTPITLLMSSLVHIIRTDNRPQFATGIIIVSNVVNLILDIVFIKFLGLGLTGAALATVIGSVVGLGMVVSHFASKRCSVHWDSSVFKRSGGFFRCFTDVIANGASGAIGMVLTTAKLLFLNLLIQNYGGKASIVAFSAVSIFQILEGAFVSGGCQSMVPVVSLLYGEGDYGGVKMAFRKAMRILCVSCLVIMAVMEAFPELAAAIYGITDAELTLAVKAIRICAPMLLGDALTYLFIYLYMCTDNKTLSSAASAVNGIALIIPTGLILAKLFGINGVWMALPTAQYIALALLLIAALALKKHKHADSIYLLDRSRDTEVTAFSVGADGYSPDEVRAEIVSKADGDTAEAVCGVLAVIADAAVSPRRSKNTDVRICRGSGYSALIKNSGARLSEESFLPLKKKYPKLIYSETIGFSQINVTI